MRKQGFLVDTMLLRLNTAIYHCLTILYGFFALMSVCLFIIPPTVYNSETALFVTTLTPTQTVFSVIAISSGFFIAAVICYYASRQQLWSVIVANVHIVALLMAVQAPLVNYTVLLLTMPVIGILFLKVQKNSPALK